MQSGSKGAQPPAAPPPILNPSDLPRAKYEARPEGAAPVTMLVFGVAMANAFMFMKDLLYGKAKALPVADEPVLASNSERHAAPLDDTPTPANDEDTSFDETAEPPSIERYGDSGVRFPIRSGPGPVFVQGDSLIPAKFALGSTKPLPVRTASNDNLGPDTEIVVPELMIARAGGGAGGGGGRDGSGGNSEDDAQDGDDVDGDDDGDDDSDRPNRAPVVNNAVFLYDIFISQSMIIGLAALLAGSTDADGDTLDITNLKVSSGVIEEIADGVFRFTAEPEMLGTVTFTYTVTDGEASVAQTATLNVVQLPGEWIDGTPNDDRLLGTPGDDIIRALDGDDVVIGREGNDIIYGSDGRDYLYGGDGDDTLFGGAGNDVLYGGLGNDVLDGGDGDDWLYGGGGTDLLIGGTGNDKAFDSIGRTTAILGDGDDTWVATSDLDVDVANGETGRDTVDVSAVNHGMYVDLGRGQMTNISSLNFTPAAFDPAAYEEIDPTPAVVVPPPAPVIATLPPPVVLLETPAAAPPEPTITSIDIPPTDDVAPTTPATDVTQEGANTPPAEMANAIVEDQQPSPVQDTAPSIDTGTTDTVATSTDPAPTDNVSTPAVTPVVDHAPMVETTPDAVVDIILNFEHVIGTNYGDYISGGSADNWIDAGGGNDHVFADAGDDVIVASDGDGHDYYNGGSGYDTLDASSMAASITLDLINRTLLSSDGGEDYVTKIEAFVLGSGDDTIVTDRVRDGQSYNGGDGADTLDMSPAGISIKVDLNSGTVERLDGGNGGIATLSEIEHILTGSGDDILIANDEQNDFRGGDGHDTFVFLTSASAGCGPGSRDRILDFEVGDRVDIDNIVKDFAPPSLSHTLIDEDMRKFILISEEQPFSRPGELKLLIQEIDGAPVAILQGNTDYDDPDVDFEIEIHGLLQFSDAFHF